MNLETVARFTPDGRAPRKDAALYIGIKPKTLYSWGASGRGPLPRVVGGRIFYRRVDLDAFIATGVREADA